MRISSFPFLAVLVAACFSNSLHAQTPAWRVEREFAVDADWNVDDAVFMKLGVRFPGLVEIRISKSGTIAVGEIFGSRVRIISADGKKIEVIEGKGNGPGTFNQVIGVDWIGATDSLWVEDYREAMRHVFAPNRWYARSYPTPGGPLFPLRLPQDTVAKPGIRASVVTSKCEGKITFGNGANQEFTPPFCDQGHAATEIVSEAKITISPVDPSSAREFTVIKRGTSGDTIFRRGFPFAPVLVTSVDVDTLVQNLSQVFPADLAPDFVKLAKDGIRGTAARVFPPVRNVVAGHDGTTWVELFSREKDHSWIILDEKGAQIASLILPAQFRLVAASRAHVWATTLSPTDDSELTRFAVRSGGN